MPEVINVNGSKNIYVFQICEGDAVAAHSLDDAIHWYKKLTGLEDDELYDYKDIEKLDLKKEVHTSEKDPTPITVGKIVEKYWEGKPFIAVTEYY